MNLDFELRQALNGSGRGGVEIAQPAAGAAFAGGAIGRLPDSGEHAARIFVSAFVLGYQPLTFPSGG